MVKITYDANGRAIAVETEFLDGILGNKVDESSDSYIIKREIFGISLGEKHIMKARLTTTRSIIDKREDAKITIGTKTYNVNDLPPELRRKLGL